jgi:uncharacterized protein (DUF169 family)
MESRIAKAVHLKYHPVALLWSNAAPQRAMQFSEGKWGCVMWLAVSAAKGRPAAADRKTFGCVGGGVGLGFGNQYKNFPGGEEGFCYFLSVGNIQRPGGSEAAESVKPFMTKESFNHFLNGERYLQSPEKVRTFIDGLPMTDIPSNYVVFKPLGDVDGDHERPQVVIFFGTPDQISALTVLANYGRGDNQNVIVPYAAGCQTIGIYPYREALSVKPRAILGLTDLSARLYVRKQLGDPHLLTFAAPFQLFEEMEKNVAGSFLEGDIWRSLLEN